MLHPVDNDTGFLLEWWQASRWKHRKLDHSGAAFAVLKIRTCQLTIQRQVNTFFINEGKIHFRNTEAEITYHWQTYTIGNVKEENDDVEIWIYAKSWKNTRTGKYVSKHRTLFHVLRISLKDNLLFKATIIATYVGFITHAGIKCMKTIAQRPEGERWKYAVVTALYCREFPLNLGGCIPRPSVEDGNYRSYWTNYTYFIFFLYMCTYDKD